MVALRCKATTVDLKVAAASRVTNLVVVDRGLE